MELVKPVDGVPAPRGVFPVAGEHDLVAGGAGPGGSEAAPRILVVVAHPDDETMVAYTLKKASLRGARVSYLYLTEGEGGIHVETRNVFGVHLAKRDANGELVRTESKDDADRRRLASVRRQETTEFHGILGEQSNLGITPLHMLQGNADRWHEGARGTEHVLGPSPDPDWHVAETRLVIEQKIREESPDYVITLSDNPKTHPQHQASYALTEQAVANIRVERGEAMTPGVFRIHEDGWYTHDTFADMTSEGRTIVVPLSRASRLWKSVAVRAFRSQPSGHPSRFNPELIERPRAERLTASPTTSSARVQSFQELVLGSKPSLAQRAAFTNRVLSNMVSPSRRPFVQLHPLVGNAMPKSAPVPAGPDMVHPGLR
jgi:LmbE family N-acetylglucosaminyl deacetylase